jgi:Cu-Zn family superoxide dismutase
VHFHQVGDDINVAYEVKNLVPNSKHGFHVHEKGDCSAADASSAGGHFNPGHAEHGDPNMPTHHAGDMGNITANDKGVAKGEMTLKNMKASSLLGTAVVVHEKEDDEKTQPTGNSGSRIACGVVVQ